MPRVPSMHEAGLARDILELVSARAREAGARRVTEVHLEIGEEAGVDRDAIALHWPILTAGTLAEGASLRFSEALESRTFRIVSLDVEDEAETIH